MGVARGRWRAAVYGEACKARSRVEKRTLTPNAAFQKLQEQHRRPARYEAAAVFAHPSLQGNDLRADFAFSNFELPLRAPVFGKRLATSTGEASHSGATIDPLWRLDHVGSFWLRSDPKSFACVRKLGSSMFVSPNAVMHRRSFCSQQDSAPEFIDDVVELSETGEVLGSYKGLRDAMPGVDNHVYVGEKKKALKDEEIVSIICNIIRRWGWGEHAQRELAQLTFSPTVHHVVEVLKQFRELNVLKGFYRWVKEQTWYMPSPYIFSLLMDRMGLAKDFEGVAWLRQEMQADGCQPNSATYNVLIKCYLRASKLDDAYACFMDMSNLKCQPDAFTFNNLIGAFVNAGLHQNAMEVFSGYEKFGTFPERHVYETMIPVFARVGNIEKASKMFDDMKSRRYQPSLQLYACLIDILGRAGRLDSAMKLFVEIKDMGKTPSAGIHVSMIESFAKAGKLEMAMKIWGDMQRSDYVPSASLYTFIIETHLKARQLDKAMQLLGSMMKTGLLPSRGLYSTFIEAHLRAKELGTAIKLFISMQEAGVLPTPQVCTALVHECTVAGDFSTTMRLFQSMSSLGFRHTEGTYALLMPILMKQTQLEDLLKIIKEMRANRYPVDGLASNALMGLLQDGHVETACKCYQLMMSESVELNSRVSRHVLESSLKDGLYEVGKLAFDRLLSTGQAADFRMYVTILSSFSRCESKENEGVMMSMLSATGHEAHRFLCGLLCSPEERKESALSFVRSYFDHLESQVDEKMARWFTCVVLNYLVLMGQIKRARCVWKVSYEKKLFPNRILFDQELSWSVDVRALSIGTALTAVVHSLHRFRKRMIHYHSIPRRIKIVTGITLKDPIEDLLKPLDSPFDHQGGALRCRGSYVAEWFKKPIVEKFLENEIPSRDEIVKQKINLLFPRPTPEPYMLILNAATIHP